MSLPKVTQPAYERLMQAQPNHPLAAGDLWFQSGCNRQRWHNADPTPPTVRHLHSGAANQRRATKRKRRTSALAERITDRGEELFVIERLHEKSDRANGHGRGARGQIFTRGDDDHLCAR